MRELWRRWAGNLGLALATIAAVPSPARAAEVHPEPAESHHHGRVPVARRWPRPMAPRGIDPESLAVCPVRRSTPLGPCPEAVRVRVAFGEAPSLLDGRRFQIERNTAAAVKWEIQAAAQRRSPAVRIRMLYGVEGEPDSQFQLKREILVLLAKITADSRIMTAAMGVGPSSSLRQIADAEALQRTRDRATFVQIEEFKGPSPLSTTLAQQMTFASLGASLFAVGSIAHPFVRRGMGDHADNLAVHPQPWPPGLVIRGSFSLP